MSPSNRRSSAKSTRKVSSGSHTSNNKPKPKLEPLPEVPASPAISETKDSQYLDSSHPPLIQIHGDSDAMHMDNANPNTAPLTSSDQNLSTAQPRQRSRTASPWRGRGRGGNSIFSRSSNPRQHMNRHTMKSASTVVQGSRSDPVTAAAGDTVASPPSLTKTNQNASDLGPNSAGLVSERTMMTGSEGASTNEYNQTSSSQARRRGHTLDPEQLGVCVSPKNPNTHFHIATKNATLSAQQHYPRPQPTPPTTGDAATIRHPPAQLTKNDSTSSNATVATIELDTPDTPQTTAAAGTDATNDTSSAPRGQLSKMLFSEGPSPKNRGPSDSGKLTTAASSSAITGRPQRGGSGSSEGRFGDYKGALMRSSTATGGMLGTRARQTTTEQPMHAQRSDTDPMANDINNKGGVPDSMARGPIEIPGAVTSQQKTGSNSTRRRGGGAWQSISPVERLTLGNSAAINGNGSDPQCTLQYQMSGLSSDMYNGQHNMPSVFTGGPGTHGSNGAGYYYAMNSGSTIGRKPVIAPWAGPNASPRNQKARRTLTYTYPGGWNSLARAPDGNPVCAAAGREGLFLFGMGPESITQKIQLTGSLRWSMAFHFRDAIWQPSENITTGSNDGQVTVWDPNRRTGQKTRVYSGYGRSVNRLSTRPENPSFVYAVFSEGTLAGWDVRANAQAPSIRIPTSLSPNDITCNPTNSFEVAVITQEGRISVWDIRNPSQAHLSFLAHSGTSGQCLSWHPTGRFIASGGSDQIIKVWDMKTAIRKKASLSPSSIIKTPASLYRLQWRPGHDTQISSCAFNLDTRFQVWDMRNPHHSLLFHDHHVDRITGFTWFDTDSVWSVGRDNRIVQCDVTADAIYTEGLLASGCADFNPTAYLAVATGHNGSTAATEPSTLGTQSEGPTSEEISPAKDVKNMAKYHTDLPKPFVDEHALDSAIAPQVYAICALARSYRYDPSSLLECCHSNSMAAASAKLHEVSKFWQFLAVSFGDALPLKPRRSRRRVSGRKGMTSKNSIFKADSQTTAVNKSRTSIDDDGVNSNNAKAEATVNSTPLQQRFAQQMAAIGASSKLKQVPTSMSHSNLQNVIEMVSKYEGGKETPQKDLSSPLSISPSYSRTCPTSAYISEPATPVSKGLVSNSIKANLATATSTIAAPVVDIPGGGGTHNKQPEKHLLTACSELPKLDGDEEKKNDSRPPPQLRLKLSRLDINRQRRITKAELLMAVESCEYYVDRGDVQTAVTALLLLQNFIRIQNWPQTRYWFIAYINQLDLYREFAAATEILLAAPFEDIRDIVARNTGVKMKCSHCRSMLTIIPNGIGFSKCVECFKAATSCSICEEPVRGRYIWCQTCGHGGHTDHMSEWFTENRQTACPSGCGHICQPTAIA